MNSPEDQRALTDREERVFWFGTDYNEDEYERDLDYPEEDEPCGDGDIAED